MYYGIEMRDLALHETFLLILFDEVLFAEPPCMAMTCPVTVLDSSCCVEHVQELGILSRKGSGSITPAV